MSSGISKISSNSRIAFRYPFLVSNGIILFRSNLANASERTGFLEKQEKQRILKRSLSTEEKK